MVCEITGGRIFAFELEGVDDRHTSQVKWPGAAQYRTRAVPVLFISRADARPKPANRLCPRENHSTECYVGRVKRDALNEMPDEAAILGPHGLTLADAGASFDAHASDLRRLLRGRAVAQDVDDLLQDTFVDLLLALRRDAYPTRPAGWLTRVALRRAARWHVRETRRQRMEVPLEHAQSSAVAPDLGDELAILDATRCLSPDQRALIWEHLGEDRTFPDIARRQGITADAARMRYTRAIAEISRDRAT